MRATYGGRSVLVTGHTGFKGSWLVSWLHHLGAVVSGYALQPPTDPSLYDIGGVGDLVARDWRADVRDLASLRAAVDESRPDVIFHMAAQPLVRQALLDPAGTFDVNVMGTVNVLEAVRLARRPCVVIVVTSDKCYENVGAGNGFVEDDRLGGTEPYGTSKAAAELVVSAYRHTYFPPSESAEHGVSIATVRAGNVIGGGDWSADRIVPDIVRALVADGQVEVRFPEAVRPWQHVVVPLSGYLSLAAAIMDRTISDDVSCTAWNFGPGPGAEVPVSQLVDDAIGLWGRGRWRPTGDSLRLHEASVLRLDTARATHRLGWYPAWDYEESIRQTISWYRSWSTDPDFDPMEACIRTIRSYEAVGERLAADSRLSLTGQV